MGEATTHVKPSRKRKEKTEVESSEVSPEKKAKTFCCRTFRQELKGNEVLKSLKRFISATKESDDVVHEYLDCGGSLQEILSVIDVTAAEDLTTALPVFEAAHLILLRCQSADSKHHEKCIESARSILRSHMISIKAMLSMTVSKHKKVALKVLTAIATLDSSFANEIMNIVALSPTLITDLIQPSSEKESVRKCFILFVLSFLIEGNITVVRTLLDKKGFLSSIIPGMKYDEATTVNLTLSLFEDKILKNVKIPKTSKLKIFNTQIIKSLFDLYDWRGPQGVKQLSTHKKTRVKIVEIDHSEKDIVIESVHSFLLLLCCSQKYGVAFYDKSLGTSDQLSNQLLLTVFESIPDLLKVKKISEVLLKTILSCPDIMRPVLLKLEPSFQPRTSKNWFQAMDFAENLLQAMDAASIRKSETETPQTAGDLVKVGKTLCAPVTFLKVIRSGSQKSEIMEIRFRCLRLLTVIWKKTNELIEAFPNFHLELKKSLHKHIIKFVLDAEDLVELWHTLCDVEFLSSVPLSQEKKIQFLTAVLESFSITLECQKSLVSSPLGLATDLLTYIQQIKESMNDRQFEDLQVKIVKLIQVDLESLSPSMELFEKSLRILLRSTDNSSLTYLSKVLSSLDIFAGNKSEVDVWFLSYLSIAKEHRSSVAYYFIKSLRVAPEEDSSLQSPLLFNCVKVLESQSEKSSKKSEKLSNFRDYINDVIVHLQFFYGVDVCFYDLLKDHKTLGKPILSFLKSWKNTVKADSDVLRCPSELSLVSWIANEETDSRQIGEVVNMDGMNFLKLYSLFRIVVAFLTKKSVGGGITENDAEKFIEALSFFLSHGPEDDHDDVGLISFDLTNKSVYQRRCLDTLFQNKHLLSGFDVFQKKQTAAYHTTAVVLKVLMRKDIIASTTVKRTLTEDWKCRFLKQLKSKLKKNKPIEGLPFLGKALDFFDYEQTDVSEIVDLLVEVSELDLYVSDGVPSGWTTILSKFVKLHCRREELSAAGMRKLCLLMEHLMGSCRSGLEEMGECFVYLMREHPNHILLVDNDFIDAILLRSNSTPKISTLGKLLLNDPNKVQHFLEILPQKLNTFKEPNTVFSLLSALIADENSFLDVISNQKNRSFWKINEIGPNTTPELYNVLEAVYNKFETNIHQALMVKESLGDSNFARHLVGLFLDKKKITKMKKEILDGNFDPILLYDAVKKVNAGGITGSYVQGLLKIFNRRIRKEDDGADWERYCCTISGVLQLNKGATWQAIVDSTEWKEFAKLAVGYCFGSTKHPKLLKILGLLVETLYKAKEESKDCALFFQMVISHSQFLKIMLGDSPLKNETVHLFYSLIQRCPSEMTPKHFPILLASYSAGLSPRDTTILQVLRLYEQSGVGVSNYEPFIWGETAVSHYSIGTSPGLSLWQRFNMRNVLDLLDGNRLELSLREFPILRSLEGKQKGVSYDENIYDPAFILPLFVNLLSPGAVVYSLTFIYKGGLAYTVRALSSECQNVRLTASVVLTRFYNHLELSQNLKQKLVWMHFINRIRFGVEDLAVQPLPNITTLFLSRMTLELSRQPAEMYAPLQNFLLAKSYFSFDTVPEFLPLFHSSETSYWKHRQWLLEVLRDGAKTSSDVTVIFHSMALKVVFCSFYSQLCDVETKKLILQVLERMLQVEKSAVLISEYSLINWINMLDLGSCQSILHDLLQLLSTLTGVIVRDIKVHKCKHSNKSHLLQILNIAVKLLPSLRGLKSIEVFGVYMKILKECLVLFIDEGQSDWFKLNKSKVFEIMDVATVVLGEKYDYRKLSRVPFYVRDFDDDRGCDVEQELRNCVFLFGLLTNLSDGQKQELAL